MATKKRSGEEINDRQILCGMGIKLRRLTAGICLVTQLVFPMTVAAQGVVNAATQQPVPAQIAIANANTVPYTLGALESAQSVAERFGISLAELRKLNQFRTFARGFDNVRQGDELDVPAQVSEKNSTPPPGNSSDNLEQQIASTSQQIGSLLAEDMNSEQAANMARGWASSQASGVMTDWLSRFGTARITLGVDEDFSLKNSQFDFLHPWYETPDNLFFSQHTLHRTDERTQINNGLGWRHFTPTWMSGINFFFDHDLSRYHSRAGIGAEYWRDYLKLSSNGYLRLTNWRSAPELDNDYEARPANGWDVRAEGWLPAWPHLGGKLVYEQYYGDEVALFDKDDRQSNPHAITAGLNYTPFPLMTFSAEQRQGKQGENDTRFAVDFTWQPGSAMQKQLDPNEVAARRSLAGSRYDLVDRNNNIVLEYRKKELVRLTLTDPVTGKSGEVKSLVSSLQTKYALKGYNVEATALEAAGGKVVTTGKDILVTLPPYRFTSTPETDNTWPIEVTAEDVKGNYSNREQSMVVVQAPTLSQKDSSVSLSTQTLSADSAITDINGKAEVTLSGTKSGTYPVTVSVINYGVSDTKQVTLIADAGTAKLTSLTSVYSFVVSTTEGATMTASVTDANGNPVEGIKVNFRGASVTLSSTSVETDSQGFAEILVTSTEVGLKTVSASLADKPTEVISRLLNASADVNSATFTSLEIPEGQVMVAQDVAVKAHVNDQFGNPVAHQPVTFSAEPSSQMIISQNTVSTNTQGIAEVTMTPERNGSYMVKASLANGASIEKQLEAIDEKLTLTASSPLIGVNSPTGATLTATLTSANGTPVEGQVINFSVTPEGATLSGGKVRTNSSGQAPVVLTSNKVGTYTVTASFHNGVTIQTQTTVKVTGNSSTAHVASFIADPSTIAATNSDLSTLKATVEDGSGNLIEGLTVYFALKSGSATLTSLTAVTDQNGIATTSVKGAMTGSVTVSAVTTAGGMQTVDITLVAGPADASQSVLKNNRSSLKGDYTDSAELHLVLYDISGNPIKVSEGMEFVQSGTNVPYVKISAIDYSQNINGDYKATVTGGGEGIATLIPVLNGVHQAGLSTTIQFTRAEDKIMSGTVLVNGANLPTTTFPSQGFTGAYYQLNNDNFAPGKTAADYEFSSSGSWVDVDATGKVTFKNVGSKWERITATPKTGGPSYIYEIRVKSWWVNAGDAFMIYSLAENFCSSNGYTLPLGDHLNHSRSRGIGSLYSEWGDMGHYTTEAGFQSNMYWSSSPANSSEQYVISLATGEQSVYEKLGFAHATCYKNL
ncbi:inverse autotransporter beta domain-containing protein [Escherichia coli]|nr:inverse autotransporter beta domain-containing protein [Escherichia coli]